MYRKVTKLLHCRMNEWSIDYYWAISLLIGHCKTNVSGRYCDQCSVDGYFNVPFCNKPCNCSRIGSLNKKCNGESGQCDCITGYAGRACTEKCPSGFYGAKCDKGKCIKNHIISSVSYNRTIVWI